MPGHLYTRKGDDGTTSLMDGRRIPKNSPSIEALGDLDELVSHLGLVGARFSGLDEVLGPRVKNVQEWVMSLSGAIACDRTEDPSIALDALEWAGELEKWTDEHQKSLPSLTRFVIPEGEGALVHVARTVCRRCERRLVSAGFIAAIPFTNRLSDYLFSLSHYVSMRTGGEESLFVAQGAIATSSPHRRMVEAGKKFIKAGWDIATGMVSA